MSWENEYFLTWFELLTFREKRYCWYGIGQWVGHMIDWRGCNFFHGRIPDSPTFANTLEAMEWLQKAVDDGEIYKSISFSGHHAGYRSCRKGCDSRRIADVSFSNGILGQLIAKEK